MKFIHASDIHLGADPDCGRAFVGERKKEIWDSFQRLVVSAEEKEVDLLLIAGDLFHRQPLARELKEVDYLFSKLTKTKVVLIAGNHDYIKQDSYYRTFSFCASVQFLMKKECESIYFKEFNTQVYGCSYWERENRIGIYDQIKPEYADRINILLAHGGDEKHAPMKKAMFEQNGFDYNALGHIHKPMSVVPNKAIYAGALEPLDSNDLGNHGYILGDITKTHSKIQFVSFARRSYFHLKIEVTPQMSGFQVIEVVKNEIEKQGKHNLYKVYLVGKRDSELWLDIRSIEHVGNIVDIVDETVSNYSFEKLAQAYQGRLLGKYITSLLPREQEEVVQKALYYGVEAILGEMG